MRRQALGAGIARARERLADGDAELVIAHLDLSFLGDVRWPGSVTIGTAVKQIGNSSITLTQAVFQEERWVAEAEVIAVQIDAATRRARPLNAAARRALDALRFADP
ncbi:MAG: hotdog domain-containing protein [Candidatus Bipolaricaulota bacterium]